MKVPAARRWPYAICFHESHIRQWRREAGVTDNELRVMAEFVLDEVFPMSEAILEAWRKSKPGDILKSPAGVVFVVTEVVDGHVWCNVTSSLISGECCRICGMMRRRDKMNKPCRGPVEIILR